MPYRWEQTETPSDRAELHLWPHQSLSAEGFSIFILSFFLLALIPTDPKAPEEHAPGPSSLVRC